MDELSERRGFTQGVAWAIALLSQHPHGPGGLLHESGFTYADFVAAKVDPYDLKQIRKVCRLEGVSLNRRAKERG